MECVQARVLLSLAGKDCRELAPSDQVLLEKHLESCVECSACAKGQQQFDQLLGQAMLAVPTPMQLQTRILAAVRKPVQPRYLPWAAAAAAVLLALGLGTFWFLQPRRTLDLEEYVYNLDRHTSASPETVESWFHENGITLAAPRQFRYEYLESFNVQSVQGQRAAHLLFHFPGNAQTRAAVAHVYVLPSRFVELEQFAANRFPTSTHTIEFLTQAGTERPDSVFMVVYTGASLDPFLLRVRGREG